MSNRITDITIEEVDFSCKTTSAAEIALIIESILLSVKDPRTRLGVSSVLMNRIVDALKVTLEEMEAEMKGEKAEYTKIIEFSKLFN